MVEVEAMIREKYKTLIDYGPLGNDRYWIFGETVGPCPWYSGIVTVKDNTVTYCDGTGSACSSRSGALRDIARLQCS